MLKRFSILCLVFILFAGTIKGQEPIKIPLTRVVKKHPEKEIIETQTNKITLYEDVDEFYVHQKQTKDGDYHQISAPGLNKSFDQGNPDLPVVSRLIEIPFDSDVEVLVLNYDTETIDLNDYQISKKIIPAQPSVNKSTDPKDVPFYKNRELYKKNSFYKKEIVQFQDKGYLRNKHLGFIEISPFQYNPVTNTLKILRNIEIEISFVSNNTKNAGNFKRLQSPLFENLDLNTINKTTEQESTKALIEGPVKYVIVSDPMFEETLQPFIEWKTQKGFNVITAYTDNPDVGTTTSSIKNYLQDLYENPTDNVSPTFVLFVGDVDQIPAFDGSAGSHVTDLYYCEYTGDNLPEVFYGRFSANSVAELQPQIDKTLEVEKYQIPNPSYLDNVVLVAGVDGTYAPTHGNGAIHYANNNYTNETNGITSYYYLYKDNSGVMSSDSPGASESIKNYISQGVSFSNYTAHCNSNGWGDPSFTNSDVPNMTNENMYPLMIGNCCLSNKFDSNAFGEVLLRAENKGAVGYIGGSNNTYWDEDFWWAVGLGTVTVDPTYEETGLGAYDKYFHLNGEAKEDWYITQGQMSVAGNLAVEASTSSRKKYYWEIYHLMGDPSLTPFITVPETLTTNYDSQVFVGTSSFTVNAEEDAYVAVSRDGVLLDAKLVDASETVILNYNDLETMGVLNLVITKQNKQPVIDEIDIVPATTPYVVLDNYIIHDNNGNGNRMVDYGEEITFDIQLKNASDTYDAFLTEATLTTADSNVVITDSLENFGTVLHSDSAKANSAFTVHFASKVEDQQKIKFEMIVTGEDSEGVTYEWISRMNIDINAPKIEISELLINDSDGNNDGLFDPGETVNLALVVKNKGNSDIENLKISANLLSEISYLNLIDTVVNNCSIAANTADTIEFKASLHADEKPGNTFDIQFDVKDEAFDYYNDSLIQEIIVGKIEEYKINTYDTVFVSTKARFYDSGGDGNNYGNGENHFITFLPENPRGKLIINFDDFDIEQKDGGGCWDYLSIYDGADENGILVGDFCNDNKPTEYLATNDQGALTFQFSSDESVTGAGWDALVENTGYLAKFVVSNSNGDRIENAIVEFDNDDKYTNSKGVVTFNYIPEGELLPYLVRKSGYENSSGTISLNTDTSVNVLMQGGTGLFDVSFNVANELNPIKGACVAFNNDTVYTDSTGMAVFNDVPESANNKYEITKEHYYPVMDSIVFAGDNITEDVLMEEMQYRVTFNVTDGTHPIESASITYNDKNEYTDKNGEFVFVLNYGLSQEFSIKKSGYSQTDTIIDVDNEKTIIIILDKTVGIEKNLDDDIKVYPNPTDGLINIEISGAEIDNYSVSVYDVLGKLVYNKKLEGHKNIREEIDLSMHSKGLYFLNIRGNGNIVSKRIIIK
ncbi:MAG: C25 family cysteine peptidase [Bacteroidales bacterium]